MFETTIQFKPRAQWRPGMTQDKLVAELDRIVQVPGLANIWVPPIRNRIDMLATGIKSPVGVKVAGANLAEIDRITAAIEHAVKKVPGVSSALADRLTGGRYIDVNINRDAAARFGMNIADVQSVVASAIGGENIGETVEGLERYPINLRYPRELRWAVVEMQRAVVAEVTIPPGYSISWSGQFEFLERATAKLMLVVPLTLCIILLLLYLLGHNLSIAGAVGFIALAGVAAEFGVIMLFYLKYAWDKRLAEGKSSTDDLLDAIREGAVLRVRPKAMTVAVILGGLLPIMFGSGTGSEVMQRTAAPMLGGMITAVSISAKVLATSLDGMAAPSYLSICVNEKIPHTTGLPAASFSITSVCYRPLSRKLATTWPTWTCAIASIGIASICSSGVMISATRISLCFTPCSRMKRSGFSPRISVAVMMPPRARS